MAEDYAVELQIAALLLMLRRQHGREVVLTGIAKYIQMPSEPDPKPPARRVDVMDLIRVCGAFADLPASAPSVYKANDDA